MCTKAHIVYCVKWMSLPETLEF